MSQLPLGDGYCFDTDVLVNLIRRYFDEVVFPDVRRDVEALIDAGLVKCPDEVLEELKGISTKAKDQDPVLPWAEAHAHIFVPLDAEQGSIVTEILRQHPKASGYEDKRKPAHADVFLVALAEVYGWCVVTCETPKAGSDKVPNLCDTRDIRSLDLRGFMKERGWRYVREIG